MGVGTTPFGAETISLGLHPSEVPYSGTAPENLAESAVTALLTQADSAARAGFDGVTLSEHHAGFVGYIPQPLLTIVQILERFPSLWAGPAPTVLGVRSPRLLAEEFAWVAASFPGRFGAAVAAGYARSDFVAVGADVNGAERFPEQLTELGHALDPTGPLAADSAIQRWSAAPAPLLAAAASPGAARRAGLAQVGILLPSGTARDRLTAIAAAYRDAGGHGPVTAVQQVWLGEPPPAAIDQLQRRYRAAAGPGGRVFRAAVLSGDTDDVVSGIAQTVDALGGTALGTTLNLRVHLPAVELPEITDQIAALGAALPRMRAVLARTASNRRSEEDL